MAQVSISVVKNEEDVIEAMIRHNIQYLDHMRFIDNGSTDRTREILEALRDEGLPIGVSRDLRSGHVQHDITNEAIAAADLPPGGSIFLLDADEFICGGDKDALVAELEGINGVAALPWKTYIPTPKDPSVELNPLLRITHRRRREVPQYFKVVLPSASAMTVTKGNHEVVGYDHTACTQFRLAHFPVRSAHQLAAKVLLGSWSVKLRDHSKKLRDHSKGEAYQWFQIAERIKAQGLPDREELQAIANHYAARRGTRMLVDPVHSPRSFTLRYTRPVEDAALFALIGFVDELMQHFHRQ